MATYTKEISRSLRISEDDKGVFVIAQDNKAGVETDLVLMNEDEAMEVYKFLHRTFGGH